jgi:5-methylcytosine-specific restriction enzyme subunit McrC
MKIPIENIYYLLCYSWNKLDESDLVDVSNVDFTELVDLFALVLKNGISQLIKKGFDRNYIIISEDTKRLKGKIDFGVSLKRNLLRKTVLHCHYDDLSYNVLHNQIIKTTVANLLKFPGIDKDTRTELKEMYLHLKDIDIIKLEKKHFRLVQLHGNNSFYDFLLKVCELIFDNMLIDESSGHFKFRNFIQDDRQMAYIFEDFIRNFYRIELPKHISGAKTYREDIHWNVIADAITMGLLPKMQTDISIEHGNSKTIIETKYYSKSLSTRFDYETESIRSVHMMQLFSYLKNVEKKGGVNFDCSGILLYVETDKHLDNQMKIDNHYVSIRTLNLNQHWRGIHDDLIGMIQL